MKVVATGDLHLGLQTDSIDRTEEIINILLDAVKHAFKLSKKERTILVLGGDIFNTNTPSEALIAEFIRVLSLIRKCELETYIMVGNHDAVADPNRLSCLGFIKRLKSGYPTLNLVEDIKFLKIGDFDNGPCYFTFLPHVSKALIQSKLDSGKLKKEISTQDYIETKCDRILEKVGKGSQHIVFSHVNVRGAHGGSEVNMLKKSEVYLPSAFINTPLGFIEPTIVQHHIHSRFKDGNINGIGSPLYCGFGEAETAKYFLEMDISEDIGKGHTLNYIPTNCTQFKQLEINMMHETRGFDEFEEVEEFLKTVNKGDIVKMDVTINPEHNHHDWKAIAAKIHKHTGAVVKPIVPRVVLKRPVRSKNQKIGLDPKKAVQVFLRRNFKHDPKEAKEIYKVALKYLEM